MTGKPYGRNLRLRLSSVPVLHDQDPSTGRHAELPSRRGDRVLSQELNGLLGVARPCARRTEEENSPAQRGFQG
jgi:hypothetical protein